jgi:hypothetical protein
MAVLTTLGAAMALGVGAPALPSDVGSYVYTQLCWGASGVQATGFDACGGSFSDVPPVTSSVIDRVIPNPDGASPDQVFRGTANATASYDTWRVATTLDLTNYRRDNYIWTPNSDGSVSAATTGVASAVTRDSITVSGGTGVYSLKYILSVEGVLATNSPLLGSSFCVSVNMPQGVGVVTGFCANAGDTVPGVVELSISNLSFETAIEPTLTIAAYQFMQPLYAIELPELGAQTVSVSGLVNFGSTVRLTSMLVTDADGNAIPGLSISSASGFAYPLDPANAVPEPATALLFLGGLVWLGTVASRRAGPAAAAARSA